MVLDATAGSDAGIDVVSSEYATVAAEQTAAERLADVVADQIVARLGAYAMPADDEVKASKSSIGRAVDQPAANVRFYLFHGPDDAQSRALGQRLIEALKASKFALASGGVKADPAVLADEAGALSLFGGPRAIWIEPAGDEIAAGVEALLETHAAESPVVAIAGRCAKPRPCSSWPKPRPVPWRSRHTRPRAPTPSEW